MRAADGARGAVCGGPRGLGVGANLGFQGTVVFAQLAAAGRLYVRCVCIPADNWRTDLLSRRALWGSCSGSVRDIMDSWGG
jgi:hypothetical protein